ncbi:MAG: hypothetical protein CBB84_009730 [Phycisphaera sp. TMED24]|nr:MAG: hypothetical protein CBB84_009730 [Phycisphaera sp. TMED24]
MNNNIIPACIIGAGLFAVALKPAPQPAPIPQAEPVAVATASVAGPSEPVVVWYGTDRDRLYRAWSDGTVEGKYVVATREFYNSGNGSFCFIQSRSGCFDDPYFLSDGWAVISSPQMACRTDINGNGEIEFGDLLAVLNQWGDQATCPDTVQLQCGLGLPNG